MNNLNDLIIKGIILLPLIIVILLLVLILYQKILFVLTDLLFNRLTKYYIKEIEQAKLMYKYSKISYDDLRFLLDQYRNNYDMDADRLENRLKKFDIYLVIKNYLDKRKKLD